MWTPNEARCDTPCRFDVESVDTKDASGIWLENAVIAGVGDEASLDHNGRSGGTIIGSIIVLAATVPPSSCLITVSTHRPITSRVSTPT